MEPRNKTSIRPAGVAYILPGLYRGGTEKHVLDLAARLDRKRFSPVVVSTAGGGPMVEDFARADVPVYLLDYRGVSLRPGAAAPLWRDAVGFFREFSRILGGNNISIVHAYLPAANVLGVFAAALARVPVKIVSKRALCRYKEGHPLFSLFEDLANWAADAVMVNSRAVAVDVRRTERFLDRKIVPIYNGIEVPPEPAACSHNPLLALGIPPGVPVVTYVANIREDKAHAVLVDAARRVAEEFPSAKFLFVGRQGCEAANVRQRIASARLEGRIILTGARQDVAQILGRSFLAAHPGEQEGFSNAILEAMAAGLPVVASRAGGNPEAVVDGETGFIVPAGDSSAFAEAILTLLRDPHRARAMGEAGRRRAREVFSMERMVGEVERLYEELLDGRRPAWPI